MPFKKLILSGAILLLPAIALAQTQVVMLGSGNPNPIPERSGPAVAVVVNGTAYLVDCGPGMVRRATAAARADHIAALQASKLQIVFITHLHSDHTVGLPDLIFTAWTVGRREPLQAYGPRGLKEMTNNIERAWRKDVEVRTRGLQQDTSAGYKVAVHEVAPGVVYKDANVTVTAIPVKHGSWDQSFGYKFQTADRSIVISGDTAPTDALVAACNGCDVMLHEVYSAKGLSATSHPTLQYFRSFHTSTSELAKLATEAHPKLLVLYHQMYHEATDEELVGEIKQGYGGKIVSAKDLDVY